MTNGSQPDARPGHAKTSEMSEHDETNDAEAWMTVEEAAAVLRLTPRQVNRYGHGDGARLRTQRVSRRVLYHRQDVLALADELNVALKPSVAIVPKAEMMPRIVRKIRPSLHDREVVNPRTINPNG